MRVVRVVCSCALACLGFAAPGWSSATSSHDADAEGGGAVRHVHVSAAAFPLRLNEIMPGPARDWDGSGAFSSRDDEWIELVNTGGAPLDLAGLFVTDGDTIPRYALSGTLAAGARMVVFGKQSYDWEKANGFPSFGLSLGNSGDAAMLWQATGADTALVDAYTYTSHESAADRAIGRLTDGTGSWSLFDALNPYTGTIAPMGNGCAPSPATPNLCGTTPTRASTWGRLKALYR